MRIIALLSMLLMLLSCATTPDSDEEKAKIQKLWPAPPDTPRYEHVMSFFSSDDFVQKSEEDKMKEFVLGKMKPQYVLKRPLALAGNQGILYLIDSDSPVVNVLDLVRRRFYKFGYRFEGKLVKPVGIALDKNGSVYVADRGRNSIIVYDSIGLFKALIHLQGVTTQIAGLSVDPSGQYLYVVDRGGIDSDAHQVVKLTTEGEVVKRIGKRGKDVGSFNLPMDIAVGPDNRLYVLDTGNFRVQVLDPEGAPLHAWGRAGNALGQFGLPRSISVDRDNLVYVSDAQFGNVQVFNTEGKLLMSIGRLSAENLPGHYSLITGINLDARGYLYVLDQYNSKMEVFKKLSPAEQQQKLRQHSEGN